METDLEVNKIIASFIGDNLSVCESFVVTKRINGVVDSSNLYTESLDVLVPVWEKLNFRPKFCLVSNCFDVSQSAIECQLLNTKHEIVSISYDENFGYQQAAAHATAKAIKELTE